MDIIGKLKKNKEAVGIFALTALVMYNLFGKKDEPGSEAVSDAARELANVSKENPPSYSKSQYKLGADTLQGAMDDQGTDEKSIYRVLGLMKNNTDFLELVIAFGVRQKYEFGIPTFEGNLARWFNDELNPSEIEEVNEILRAKGIKFRF
jgi:hypothetical protein